MGGSKKKSMGKIVILGLDGLSPAVMEPMIKRGKLPSFSELRSHGSYRPLATTNPSQSPVAWAGFATGQNPGKNGIFDFIARDPSTYRLELSLSNIEEDRAKRVVKSKAFWHYTSAKRVPTVVISCPLTFPPDRIHGRMLSGMGVPDVLRTEGTFSYYTSEKAPGVDEGEIEGNVFSVRKSSTILCTLIGPATGDGRDNVTVPFKVTVKGNRAAVLLQGKEFDLVVGRWSEWREVTFKTGLFKKVRGIVRFLLRETDPHFKLYASPVNFDPRDPFFPISHPGRYSRDLAGTIGLFHTQGMPADTWAVNEQRLDEDEFLEHLCTIFEERRAILDHELANENAATVIFCYFDSVDIVQHMFWRCIDTGHPLYNADHAERYGSTIADWYVKLDEMVGSIRRRLGPDDTLIILSDHGCGTFRRAVHVNSWLREKGYLELASPAAESGADLLADIDWSRTKAYAIGFGAVYINLEGREGGGIVHAGREAEDLKREIAEQLKRWHDKRFQSPVVSSVYRGEDIFRGPHAAAMPDLYIGFNIGYRASKETALGGVPGILIEDNRKKWSGSHLFDPPLVPGVLFSSRGIRSDWPSITDIAPTILKLTGYSDEEIGELDMDGAPLH